MAERRMFSKTIIDSDAFLDMPLSAQSLYFHLSMRADDDGFINNPKKIQRMIGAADDDMKLLIVKNFIIPFESGIVVIKHWKIHNYIQSDRYKPTVYHEEKKLLEIKKNKAYTLAIPDESAMETECIQDVYRMDTQVRLGKDRIGKDSVGKCSVAESEPTPPAPAHTPPTPITYESLCNQYGKSFVDERIERSKRYPKTNNIETVAKWCEEDFKNNRAKNSFHNFTQRTYNMEEVEKNLLKRQQIVNDDP